MKNLRCLPILLLLALASTALAREDAFQVLHVFDEPEGWEPFGDVTAYEDRLYGLTHDGGEYGMGVVYSLKMDGTDYKVIHHMKGKDGKEPMTGVLVHEGNLYFAAKFGGDYGDGVLARLQPDGSEYEVLHHFRNAHQNGFHPHASPIEHEGALYGTTFHGGRSRFSGTLYRYDLATGEFDIIVNFSPERGEHPTGSVIAHEGYIYGFCSDFNKGPRRGTLWRVKPTGEAFEILHEFAEGSGGYPYGEPAIHDGYLYGTGYGKFGDPADFGELFRYNLETGEYERITDFMARTQLGVKPNGGFAKLPDGRLVFATHGNTPDGGNRPGTLVAYDPDDGELQPLHMFNGGMEGETPVRRPIYSDGAIFGATAFGGNTGLMDRGGGIVYRYNLQDLNAEKASE